MTWPARYHKDLVSLTLSKWVPYFPTSPSRLILCLQFRWVRRLRTAPLPRPLCCISIMEQAADFKNGGLETLVRRTFTRWISMYFVKGYNIRKTCVQAIFQGQMQRNSKALRKQYWTYTQDTVARQTVSLTLNKSFNLSAVCFLLYKTKRVG